MKMLREGIRKQSLAKVLNLCNIVPIFGGEVLPYIDFENFLTIMKIALS